MTHDIAFELWLESIQEKKKCVLATVIQDDLESKAYQPLRVFIDENEQLVHTLEDEAFVPIITEKMLEKLSTTNPNSETITITLQDKEQVTVFVDVFIPQMNIMIFGAGHDAIPLAKYSVSLGYETTVVDAREGFNTAELFPNTTRIIARPESYREHVHITENTYVIVMNHHIEKDKQTLAFVLPSKAAYVGVLGPRSRRERMMNQLQEEGTVFSSSSLSKMYNPVGLDIGAETPEEIAISIIAEVIAVRKGHEGGFLHDHKAIHKNRPTHDTNLIHYEPLKKV